VRLRDLIGQDAARSRLLRALRAGRLPQALLFQGPEHVGKGSAARALGAVLLCPRATEDACGECSSCERCRAGAHPDLLIVRRASKRLRPDELPPMTDPPADEGEELRPFIRVDQIRELSRHASYAPREGTRRVFVIDPADRMNEAAQNALLKTLEEPPGETVLVLVASRPHLLLPTVRSRCLAVRFAAMPVRELARALEQRGMSADEATTRASLSGGLPGLALSLDLERARARREAVLGIVEASVRGPRVLARLSDAASVLAGRGEAELLEGLSMLEDVLRDAARAAVGAGEVSARHAGVGQALGPERLFAILESVQRLRADLRFNLNRGLVAETLLAALAGGPLP